MRSQAFRVIPIAAVAMAAITVAAPWLHAQHVVRRPIDGRPDAIVNLRTADGVRLVKGQWRYSQTT